MGNHRHAFDPVVMMSHTKRTVHFMAKESLFKGLHGLILKEIGLIKIYRTKKNPQAVFDAEKILNEGGAVGIFPEGTRNKTQEDLLRFRQGAIRIAQKTNSTIIPFAINGQYKIFRKKLKLSFGDPIDVSKMEKEDANDFVRNEVLKLFRG